MAPPSWTVVFFLPNLDINAKVVPPNDTGLTLGLTGLAISRVDDARVKDYLAWSPAAAQFMAAFRKP